MSTRRQAHKRTRRKARVTIAPAKLVAEVARLSKRSVHTVYSVLYGRMTSQPVQAVIERVRRDENFWEDS